MDIEEKASNRIKINKQQNDIEGKLDAKKKVLNKIVVAILSNPHWMGIP